jgi:pimeloyl-ACP methyl ester carboxylesterase
VRDHVILPDCAHWIPVEQPHALVQVIQAICRLGTSG